MNTGGPVHLGFPLRLNRRGRLQHSEEEAYLRGLVEAVLFTRPGERINRPEFGTGVHALVFAPAGDELAGVTRSLVQASLQQWLGELIRVEGIRVEAEESTIQVTVVYAPLRAGAVVGPPRTMTVSGSAGGAP
ncbi:GPW/gp25 family protein [Streptomyces sp. NBC_01244]|uniref:GPW/gp25 family protein n=1 Tax=Streptomyces sp. NBC_01244 TaxID=2903797 RepID=UPI002E14A9F0|nr:GPW/gp25 family protein [Streptomyces sp. NBC_01244]